MSNNQNPSNEQDYNALPLGANRPSFEDFGSASLDAVQQYCKDLNLSGLQRIIVESVWTRHPSHRKETDTYSIPLFTFPNHSEEAFPMNGVGAVLLQRSELVENTVDMILGARVKTEGFSYYFRAPKASGKTIFLYLIGRELQRRGEIVYFIEHAELLNKILKKDLQQLERLPGQRIFLLVDEVHKNPDSAIWNFLLKESKSFITIGVGIPDLSADSPAFHFKFDPSYLFLTEKDLPDEIINYFSSLINSNEYEKMKSLLHYLLSYTGGHAYPFLKIAQYLMTEHRNLCLEIDKLSPILCGTPFFRSEECRAILNRSFQINSEVLASADATFSSGIQSILHEGILSKYGFWNVKSNWFISDLFVTYLFQQRKKQNIPDLTIEKILHIGLEKLNNSHFSQLDEKGFTIDRYEDSIGHFIGYNIASIQELYISPQHIIPREDKGTRGKNPCVDYYVNGKFDTFLEIVLNGSLMKEHFDRFENITDGKYVRGGKKRDNYVILDIKLTGDQPEIPEKYSHRADKLYTFIKEKNQLYQGNKMILERVSSHFPYQPKRQFSTKVMVATWIPKLLKFRK